MQARLDGLTLAALTAAAAYLVRDFFGVTVYNTAPFLFIMLGLGYVHGTDESPSGAVTKFDFLPETTPDGNPHGISRKNLA